MNHNFSTRTGIVQVVSAYLLWGFAPLYFSLLSEFNALDILMHRIVWSALFLFVLLLLMKQVSHAWQLLKQLAIVRCLALSALCLAINWLVFIWAVNNEQLLAASLGYFINPLITVALGVLFLGERLRRGQKVALVLACTGLVVQLVTLGELPVVSLILALAFGFYGLLRKTLNIDALTGLFIESLLMLPAALVYWALAMTDTSGNLLANSWQLNTILMLSGWVTLIPLLFFTGATRRLSLSSLGFFQYLGPILMFMLAIAYYQEPINTANLISFIIIWLALVVYTIDLVKLTKKLPEIPVLPEKKNLG